MEVINVNMLSIPLVHRAAVWVPGWPSDYRTDWIPQSENPRNVIAFGPEYSVQSYSTWLSRQRDREYLLALLTTRLLARQAGIDFIALPATRTIHDDRHRSLAELGKMNGKARTTLVPRLRRLILPVERVGQTTPWFSIFLMCASVRQESLTNTAVLPAEHVMAGRSSRNFALSQENRRN